MPELDELTALSRKEELSLLADRYADIPREAILKEDLLRLGMSFDREALQYAAGLTYTTLLSLVPLMTVTLAVFSAFPVADRVYLLIQDFVF